MRKSHDVAIRHLVIAALAVSGTVFAGGNHAGGHAHVDDAESAIGKPGSSDKIGRTITVEMSDTMRYTPSDIEVRQGETVRFIVKNVGQVKHELSLGTETELLVHLEQMKKFPDMEHDEPSKVTLAPGKQGEIIWHFTKTGTVHFACLMPGHYEAGMRGVIKVDKKHATMDNHKMDMTQVPDAMTDGEVKKVDHDTGKITIKHGEIKHLEMPSMTMVFTARDKSLLANIKPGDKIKFAVINAGGKMVVTNIQPAR